MSNYRTESSLTTLLSTRSNPTFELFDGCFLWWGIQQFIPAQTFGDDVSDCFVRGSAIRDEITGQHRARSSATGQARYSDSLLLRQRTTDAPYNTIYLGLLRSIHVGNRVHSNPLSLPVQPWPSRSQFPPRKPNARAHLLRSSQETLGQHRSEGPRQPASRLSSSQPKFIIS